MDEIRWGIIGCGNVTEVKSGPAFNKVPGSKLVAVMRRDAAKARDYAERHDVPQWFDDATLLLDAKDINAVYVATPPSTHEKYAIAALERGLPVYVEKPMSVNAASALRIVQAAEKHNTKICVAHYRREMPLFKKVGELIRQNAIGKVLVIELRLYQPFDAAGFAPSPENWRLDPAVSGGGIFHDLAPHQLDLMLHYFGLPVNIKSIAFNQGAHYEANDLISASIRFHDNILFNGIWSFNAPSLQPVDTCRIIGENGFIQFGIFKMENIVVSTNGIEEEFKFEPLPHVQQPMIAEVVRYFRGERHNPCSGNAGIEVMRMIDEIALPSR